MVFINHRRKLGIEAGVTLNQPGVIIRTIERVVFLGVHMKYTDYDEVYSDSYIQDILSWVRTIAIVGASDNPSKPSYDVLQILIAAGYDMIPVNPRRGLSEILGLKVYPSLKAIDRPVDMVDVFRPSRELVTIARNAVEIEAKVFWTQLGIYNSEAASIADKAGLKVVMDRCPKIELAVHPQQGA